MALMQAYEVRVTVRDPKAKEQAGVLIFSDGDERRARDRFEETVGDLLAGSSNKYDVSRWTSVTLTGPNGTFDRSMRVETVENAQAGPGERS